MSEYWQICLPEALEDMGIHLDGVDVAALCARVAEVADLAGDYSAPVSRARIGPSDYERGVAEGRRQALAEVEVALGKSLELANGRDGLRLQMSEDAVWRGHSNVKVY